MSESSEDESDCASPPKKVRGPYKLYLEAAVSVPGSTRARYYKKRPIIEYAQEAKDQVHEKSKSDEELASSCQQSWAGPEFQGRSENEPVLSSDTRSNDSSLSTSASSSDSHETRLSDDGSCATTMGSTDSQIEENMGECADNRNDKAPETEADSCHQGSSDDSSSSDSSHWRSGRSSPHSDSLHRRSAREGGDETHSLDQDSEASTGSTSEEQTREDPCIAAGVHSQPQPSSEMHSTSELEAAPNIPTTEDNSKQKNFQDLRIALQGEYANRINQPVTATKAEALLMALSLAKQHSFNNKELINTLTLINSLFNSPVLPSSKYLLDKLINCDLGLQKHFVCQSCKTYLGVISDCDETKTFSCPNCNALNNISLRDATHFVTFDISLQLEVFFNRFPEARENLFNPKHALQREEGILADVYDGTAYKNFVRQFVANEPDNITVLSFNFCVDGSPLFSSSSCEIWPLNLMIFEAPIKLRIKHLILGGLWFGKGKPDMNSFFKPFVEQLQTLSSGFTIKVKEETMNVKAHLMACCVDSGARGAVQCISTHRSLRVTKS